MAYSQMTGFNPEYWSKRIQNKLYKTDVYRPIANFEERSNLKNGDTVNRPYLNDINVGDYSPGTALSAQDQSISNEQLSINKIKAALFYVDGVDKVQNKYSAINKWSDETGIRLSNAIDAEFFYNYSDCADTIDDGDVGGTAGNALTPTISNIINIFGKTNRKLDANNVPREGRYFAVSPQFVDVLWQYIAGKESLLGDKTGVNGHIGRFAGFDLYMTNNLTGTAVWTPVDTPTNTDTLVVNGVTFTFVDTIGSAAGNILQDTSVAETIINMGYCIADTGATEDTDWVALSTANQAKVDGWVFTGSATAATFAIKGGSYLTVTSEEASDLVSSEVQHCMAGQKNTIDMVVQKAPGVEMQSTVSAGKIGTNVIPWSLFGTKMFNEATNRNLDVQLDSSEY